MNQKHVILGVLPCGSVFAVRMADAPPVELTGPGEVTISVTDRRVATQQRRARGWGISGHARRLVRLYGRREGDEAAHQERRDYSRPPPIAFNAGGRRSTDLKDRRGAPCVLFGGKRVLDPKERRSRLTKVYRSSTDPRVRLLERRNGRPYSFVTCPAPPMAAVAEGQRRADPSQYFIPPENRK